MVHSFLDLSKDTLEISPNWAPLVIRQNLKPSGKISYCDRIGTGALIEHEKLNPGRMALDLEVMNLDSIWGAMMKKSCAKECTFSFCPKDYC